MPYPVDLDNVYIIVPCPVNFDGQYSLVIHKARGTAASASGNYNQPILFDSATYKRDPDEVLADEVEHYIVRAEERLRDDE